MPAAGALQQRCPHRPRFVVPASRTTKTLRPAELTQILSTGLLGGETRLELGQIPRIIFHFPDPTSCGHLSQVNTHLKFFDTANVYNQGRSEEILGAALGPRRKQVVLASKVRGLMKQEPSYGGLSRAAIRRGIEESLVRLGTDYLALYYLHQPDYDIPIEETLETVEELRREGKIRYSATSNYSAWQLCEIFWLCEKNGMGIYLTQVLGNSPYMLWSSVARVAVPPTSDL